MPDSIPSFKVMAVLNVKENDCLLNENVLALIPSSVYGEFYPRKFYCRGVLFLYGGELRRTSLFKVY